MRVCLGFAEVEFGSMTGDHSGGRMPATQHGGFLLFAGTNCEQPNCCTTMICTHADQQPQRHFLPAYHPRVSPTKTRTHEAQIKGSRFSYQTSHSCFVPVNRRDCTNLTSTTAPDRCSACVSGHCRQAFDSRLLIGRGHIASVSTADAAVSSSVSTALQLHCFPAGATNVPAAATASALGLDAAV